MGTIRATVLSGNVLPEGNKGPQLWRDSGTGEDVLRMRHTLNVGGQKCQ